MSGPIHWMSGLPKDTFCDELTRTAHNWSCKIGKNWGRGMTPGKARMVLSKALIPAAFVKTLCSRSVKSIHNFFKNEK